MGSFLTSSLPFIALVAALGSSTMAGLLFAFSNVVMRALTQVAPGCGMEAMQRINVTIVNPVFMALFIGTPVLYLLVGLGAVTLDAASGRWWLLSSAGSYLVGVLGVTMLLNVPLNHALAQVPAAAAADRWPAYVATWTRWNHVRTVWAFVATGMAVAGALSQLLARAGATR